VTAVAWPPAGFVPAPLIPERWSLQDDATADFSNATVAVTQNGTPQTVEILSDNADGYAGNAIVWDLPFAPAPQPGQQTVYAVDIENVLIDGKPQSFSYTTTSFDPAATTVLESVPAQVEFLQPAAQVAANSSSIAIEVARSMNADQQASVHYVTSNGTAIDGTDYVASSGTITFAPGQFYSQIVVPILPDNSQSSGETFSIALYSPSQASIGAVSMIQISIARASSATGAPGSGTGAGSVSGSPIAQPPVNAPPHAVAVTEVVQSIVAGRTPQARRTAARLAGFQIAFSGALAPLSAVNRKNYAVFEYRRVRRRIIAQPVSLRASYDPSGYTVSLVLIGKHPFLQGGRLVLNDTPPYGISDPSGELLAGNTTFAILPGTNGIMQ
jgi:hypothetical protein